MTMGLKLSLGKVALGALVLTASLWARSTGPGAGVAGVPGENVCTACHTTNALNSGAGSLKLQLVDASSYTPGQQYKIMITLSDPAARRWGFEITARSASDTTKTAGKLDLSDPAIMQFRTGTNTEYVTHLAAGTRQGQADSSTWEVLWTAPAAAFGPVTFYAAGNAANNDGTNQNDFIYTTTLTVNQAESKPPVTSAIPQLMFGDGYASALYLYNPNSTAATAEVRFNSLDGGTMGDPISVDLPAKGTGYVELADGAPLARTWVEVKAPEGVTGYGLIRRTVESRVYETTVPLSGATSTGASVLFDETGAVTSAALVNLGSDAAMVTLTARDSYGVPIATITAPLASRSVIAGPVSALPGLAAIQGQRGSLEISSTAPVAASVMRVTGESMAALPVMQK